MEIAFRILSYLMVLVFCAALLLLSAVAATTWYAVAVPIAYFSSVTDVMVRSPSPPEPRADAGERTSPGEPPHDDREVAYLSYFYGPAVDDLTATARTAWNASRRVLASGRSFAADLVDNDNLLMTLLISIGVALGLFCGGVLGGALTLVVATAHAVAAAATLTMVRSGALALRGGDTLLRFMHGIRTTCRGCSRDLPRYPAYRCPRDGCGRLHRDIRPGAYGILRRFCRCGTRLPTLRPVVASRLEASCPFCGTVLPAGAGAFPECVVPLFGGVGVGKTRLLYTIVLAIDELAQAANLSVEYLDEETERRLDDISKAIGTRGHTAPTRVSKRPRAYSLRIDLPEDRRFVYLFDAAGEAYYSFESARELAYLLGARTLVLVVDPLAVEGLYARLSAPDRQRLAGTRSEGKSAELAFEQTCELLDEMGVRTHAVSLALVVTKADLLVGTGTGPRGPGEADIEDWITDPAGLGLGNLVRNARQRFERVRYFHTASLVEEGTTHRTVVDLTRWLLREEGVLLRSGGRHA